MKLEARSVSVEYLMRRTQRRILALEDVSFSVEAGRFVAIVGPSGCGKTTLLSVIAGLQRATAGQVLLDGVPVTSPGRNRAMVFQSAALMPWRTVMGNVTYGLELQGSPRGASRQAAQRLIELVGLRGFEESLPRELSGGMQQRVNLARALATAPELLLMDEPLAGLDAQMRELMQVELQRVYLETRKTTLYVTHSIDEAIFLADEVIAMTARPGRVKMTLPIGLPRPRPLGVKQTSAFHILQAKLWDLIKEELSELVDGGLEAPA